MYELLLLMIERLGLIVMLAFIASRLNVFRNIFHSAELTRKQQIIAIIFFSIFGILGTYSGITFQPESIQLNRFVTPLVEDEAIANFRVIGPVLAGLFGGYPVGIGVGIIAGVHRMTLGGFTALACGLATIFSGALAAYYAKRHAKVTYQAKYIFLLGAIAEALQMGLIVVLSFPTSQAIQLVQAIGIPMIIANGLGCMLFFMIIKSVKKGSIKLVPYKHRKVYGLRNKHYPSLKQD